MSNPLGNWHDKIGTSHENSPHREAPNKHVRGGKNYKEMIDRGSKEADKKNLPFTFGKPSRKTQHRRDLYTVCDHCQDIYMASKYTAGRTCGRCHKWTSVNPSNTYATEEEVRAALGED